MKYVGSILVAILVSVNVWAQSGYQPGQKVKDFTLKDGSGKNVSLHDFAGAKMVVVVFTNNLCPYSKLYENRLVNLNNAYQNRGVKFIFINPAIGSEGGETIADLAQKAGTSQQGFPYLADEGHKISQAFGATKMPEVFVMHGIGQEFTLQYKGAIDDNPQLEGGVKEAYLKNAIEAVLNGRNVQVSDIRATGCLIKKY